MRSHPPHFPNKGHEGTALSAHGDRTSSNFAAAKSFLTSTTCARTRSPGNAIAVALMLASTVVYFVTYGENESAESLSSAIIMTVFTVVMAALGALHVMKFVKPLKPQQ